MSITVCAPDQVAGLLPDALAGRRVLLPVPEPGDAAALRPDLPAEPDAAVIVTTSGSTGQPKGVLLSAAAMLASAAATRGHLGGPMRWYSPLPHHYVAGLMVLTRAIEAGTSAVTVARDLGDLPPAGLVEPRALSIVPTQLYRALDDPDLVERLAGFDAVLVGGAATQPDLVDRARKAGVRVVLTYGMSETCGGCVYDGLPLPGVEVDLEPEVGRVRLAGPMLFSGYRLDPELTAATLVDGQLLTRDHGEWVQGRLQLHGRLDDVVISGGVNVDLALVRQACEQLQPGHTAVVAVPDAEWGQRIVLVTDSPAADGTAPLDTADGTADELAGWRDRLAATGLGRAALPRHLVRLSQLPRTSSGKIDAQALTDQLSATEED